MSARPSPSPFVPALVGAILLLLGAALLVLKAHLIRLLCLLHEFLLLVLIRLLRQLGGAVDVALHLLQCVVEVLVLSAVPGRLNHQLTILVDPVLLLRKQSNSIARWVKTKIILST